MQEIMKNQMVTGTVPPGADSGVAGVGLAIISAVAVMGMAVLAGGVGFTIPRNCGWCCCP
jgi:hypothetical protein